MAATKEDLPTVSVLAAVSKDGKTIWVQGIEDGYTYVQVSIPSEYFTDVEKEKFNGYQKQCLAEGRGIYMGEHEAHNVVDKYENFEIKIVEIPFDAAAAIA